MTEEQHLGHGFLHDWRRRFFRFGLWNLMYRTWFRIHICGWENIPSTGPTLMIGNHIHAFDPVIMISMYPDRDVVPLAKIESYDQPVIGFFVRHWGAIPVMRGEADTRAMKEMIRTIKDDDKVGMLYIEGTRSRTGLIEGQVGSAFIALKTDSMIVPTAIWGTRDFPGSWYKDIRPVQIYMNFGKPFRLVKPEGRTREHLTPMTTELMYQIARLLPEEWRGEYRDLENATTEYLDFDVEWKPAENEPPHWCKRFNSLEDVT